MPSRKDTQEFLYNLRRTLTTQRERWDRIWFAIVAWEDKCFPEAILDGHRDRTNPCESCWHDDKGRT